MSFWGFIAFHFYGQNFTVSLKVGSVSYPRVFYDALNLSGGDAFTLTVSETANETHGETNN